MYKLLKHLENENGPRRARGTPGQLVRAVFWSFFGVRKMKALKADALTLTPLQLIVAGIIGCLLLVMTLLSLVRALTS